MALSAEEQYDELSFYTLAHQDISFIHQHAVDAHIAQTAHEHTKSISIIFSLVGLYLYIEKSYTGRQVQQFHIKMAKNKRLWPKIFLPVSRGDISVTNVLACAPGEGRDEMIGKWSASVWDAYKDSRETIIELVRIELKATH